MPIEDEPRDIPASRDDDYAPLELEAPEDWLEKTDNPVENLRRYVLLCTKKKESVRPFDRKNFSPDATDVWGHPECTLDKFSGKIQDFNDFLVEPAKALLDFLPTIKIGDEKALDQYYDKCQALISQYFGSKMFGSRKNSDLAKKIIQGYFFTLIAQSVKDKKIRSEISEYLKIVFKAKFAGETAHDAVKSYYLSKLAPLLRTDFMIMTPGMLANLHGNFARLAELDEVYQEPLTLIEQLQDAEWLDTQKVKQSIDQFLQNEREDFEFCRHWFHEASNSLEQKTVEKPGFRARARTIGEDFRKRFSIGSRDEKELQESAAVPEKARSGFRARARTIGEGIKRAFGKSPVIVVPALPAQKNDAAKMLDKLIKDFSKLATDSTLEESIRSQYATQLEEYIEQRSKLSPSEAQEVDIHQLDLFFQNENQLASEFYEMMGEKAFQYINEYSHLGEIAKSLGRRKLIDDLPPNIDKSFPGLSLKYANAVEAIAEAREKHQNLAELDLARKEPKEMTKPERSVSDSPGPGIDE